MTMVMLHIGLGFDLGALAVVLGTNLSRAVYSARVDFVLFS